MLGLPGVRAQRSSAGLGWPGLFVSTQVEPPFAESFDGADTHLLILHLDGSVAVGRRVGGRYLRRQVPAGGLFLHPAGQNLTVELGGELNSVHVYLADETLRAVGATEVRLTEEYGVVDPLVEQLVLALDSLIRDWTPSARTFLDHLTGCLASHLARRYGDGVSDGSGPLPTARGLADRQFAAVRELMDDRLAGPLPLNELAAAASLSVRQFARSFKATTGQTPHRYLMELRLQQATWLLRTGSVPIAEVAMRCGFAHQEHLTRVMRSQLGTTPGALRRAG
ncbi:AraC family transcriptional regulator [Micromonospora acroterricola]|uniref:AraC family transcriptional regulator n=2 Tax=Micromonospora acroterricola TaxID=2202421 RepID=A0A317DE25_9ACTN|nr:AraC family transcriptional regulator [Micromonospora acroterricola]